MRSEPLAQLAVAHRDAQAFGFDDRRLVRHELLNEPLADAELPNDVFGDAAVLGPNLRDLLEVLLLVDARRDASAVHRRDDVGRRGDVVRVQELGHIQQDEGRHDNGEAPFQIAPVAPHPVEHRHGRKALLPVKRQLCHWTGPVPGSRFRGAPFSGSEHRIAGARSTSGTQNGESGTGNVERRRSHFRISKSCGSRCH